jgi:hypothetical protein
MKDVFKKLNSTWRSEGQLQHTHQSGYHHDEPRITIVRIFKAPGVMAYLLTLATAILTVSVSKTICPHPLVTLFRIGLTLLQLLMRIFSLGTQKALMSSMES